MTRSIRAGIVGGAGYTGGETLRLLLRHPRVEVAFVQSRSQAGKPVTSTHPDLIGETDLIFAEGAEEADVVFLCLGHGESKKLLGETSFGRAHVIDLGNDFRLGDSVAGMNFVYGLPEFQREAIQRAQHVANPGCFATAIQLGLLPLAQAGQLSEVHVTGITGSTGAGQKLQDSTHFTWRANNISAYKTLTHQHLGEIRQTLQALQPGFDEPVHFIPWRGDFTRGIYTTAVVGFNGSPAQAYQRYREYYAHHPFTHVTDVMIDLKQVINTNKCMIHLEVVGKKLAIHTALDNLIKGASGQAVQNMNLLFGFEETEGLRLKASIF